MKLGDYLEKAGHSVRAFARKCEVSETTIRRVMDGQPPNLSIAIRISEETLGKVALRDMAPEAKAATA